MAIAEPTAEDLELLSEGCEEVSEAMKASGLRHSAFYQKMASGEIPYVQLGRKRVIPRRGLRLFLARNLVPRQAQG